MVAREHRWNALLKQEARGAQTLATLPVLHFSHTPKQLPLLLRPRVELAVHRFQALLIDVGVHLRCRDVGMAEHLLDNSEISPVSQQVGSETVSQEMGINVCFQSRLPRAIFHDLPNARCR